ncbi:MAG: hypothetical protein R3D00_21200 [Bacteroidia bacterium]
MKKLMKSLSLTVCMIFLTTGQPFTAYAGQVGSRDSLVAFTSEEEPIKAQKPSEILIKESSIFGIAAMISSAVVLGAIFLSFFSVIHIGILVLIPWALSILLSVIGIVKAKKARRMMSSPWEEYDEKKWKKSNRAIFFNTVALILTVVYPMILAIYASIAES